MRVLLVAPSFPVTYWGFQYAMPFVGKQAALPPLGLITVAALLPSEWNIRLVDTNVRALTAADLQWAQVVMTGGMRVQLESTHVVVDRATAAGCVTVVGGAAASTVPSEYSAHVVFQGELEGRVPELEAAIDAARRGGAPRVLAASDTRPELSTSPVPRFDLLELGRYGAMSLQYSRGCPFRCEFCDVIELFGRRPRVKSSAQMILEFDALHAAGYRGTVFVVDDNFIGHRRAVLGLLHDVIAWQKARRDPFTFCTEASINLSQDPELVQRMIEAGFDSVFVGIETVELATLAAVGKTQNTREPPLDSVRRLQRSGLEVMGGFIVGFDEDGPHTFDAQRRLIDGAGVPVAMVGLLSALPGTALERRLSNEGRLRQVSNGDQFGRPNFVPRMDEVALLRGYAGLMAALYDAEVYYARCRAFVDVAPRAVRRGSGRTQWRAAWRALVRIGLRAPRAWPFWRLILHTLRRAPRRLEWAITRAIQGEHLIRYTEEHVLPTIRRQLRGLDRRPEVVRVACVEAPVASVTALVPPIEALDKVADDPARGCRLGTVGLGLTS